jgi:hypothetical protein
MIQLLLILFWVVKVWKFFAFLRMEFRRDGAEVEIGFLIDLRLTTAYLSGMLTMFVYLYYAGLLGVGR